MTHSRPPYTPSFVQWLLSSRFQSCAMDTDHGFNTPHSEQTESSISKIPKILPHERVFPIQIGTELFKLSGASLSFDGEFRYPVIESLRQTDPGGRGNWGTQVADWEIRCDSPVILLTILPMPAEIGRGGWRGS